ncbi:MAG TPA: O-antigen ligase family protein [Acidobacteriaceae bacterium]|jgi:O-antigen ligase|nr:O-antigen ligase family protein [Acidobacteriaceae bacterium]
MSPNIDNLENEPHSESPTSGLPFAVGFYFAFRIITVLASVRVFGADPSTGTAINIALDCFLLLATAFCSIGEVRYPFREMIKLPSVRWALLFLGFSCCSLLWSSTVSLPDSLANWCAMAADFTIIAMLLRTGPLIGVSDSLMKGFIWGACTVAIIAWLMPAESDLRLGDAELLGPNQIGYVCASAFFFAQYLIREKRGKVALPAFVLAVTLLRTLSKTTIVAFLVGEGFLLIRDKSISRRNKILIAFAAVAVVAVFWGLLTSYYDIYTNAGNQSETLSGRLGIWAYFLSEAVQQPWIGHGFDSAWKVIPPFGPDEFEAAHAHNELLQQFYAYGAVGVCMFFGIYISIYRHIRRIAAGPLKAFFFSFLLFILVRGTADTERFDLSLPMWAIVMFSLLIEDAQAIEHQSTEVLHAVRFPLVMDVQPSSMISRGPAG